MNDYLPKVGVTDFFLSTDGIKIRYGIFPAVGNAVASILLLNGHREFLEKYSEFIEDLQARNFTVYSMDHRGQGLSGRVLCDNMKSHNPDFGLIISDINLFVSNVVKPENQQLPFYIISHSLGSHLALRYLHDYPDVVHKALLLSPFSDMDHHGKLYLFFAKIFFKIMNILGFSERFAPGQVRGRSMIDDEEAFSQLTHDPERYQWSQNALNSNPALFLGGVTYGWIKGAMQSIGIIKAKGFMENISTPILCLLSGEETVVNNESTVTLLKRAPNVKIDVIEGARHEIYRESDEIRAVLFEKIEDFLKP